MQDLATVALGIGGVLATGSLAGRLLRLRYADNPAVENLIDRVRAWWVMAGVMLAALALGRGAVLWLFGLCAFAALREFMTLTSAHRADHKALVAAFFVILPAQFWLIGLGWYGLWSIFIPVYAFLILPVISALSGQVKGFLTRVAEMQWALMICVFCLSHVPALLDLEIPQFGARNVLLIAWLVIVVQMSDVLQYVWGKLAGRHKIAPALSPSKTVEGYFGGVLSATALGAALAWMTPFAPLAAFGMAFLLTQMGFLGGLVMSAIKRDRGVKDWGHGIAGHGGFIDRLDSVLFAAPVFYHVTRYFYGL